MLGPGSLLATPGFGIRSRELKVEVVSAPSEVQRFEQCLTQHHRLGSRRPKGRNLLQAILWQERWVGLILWCGSVWHLEDRDRWIGWDPCRRVERLQLVVHQARFLVLPDPGPTPRASAMLSAATRALLAQWQQRFGYQPLLAETFTDPRFHTGTSYRAANWRCIGRSGCGDGDPLGSPKQIWVFELHPAARTALASGPLAPVHQGGLSRARSVEGPLSLPLLRSLRRHLAAAVLCPQLRPGRFLPRDTVLSLLAVGLLRREASLAQLSQLARRLSWPHARALGFPAAAGTAQIRPPSPEQLLRCLRQLDVRALLHSLESWVRENGPSLPGGFARHSAQWCGCLARWQANPGPNPVHETPHPQSSAPSPP